MFDPITVSIPGLPYPELMPNKMRRAHWSERATYMVSAHQEGRMEARQQAGEATRIPADVPLAIHIDAYEHAVKQRKDADNLVAACKGYIDGMCEQFGVDDGMVEVITLRRHIARPDHPARTVYTISPDRGSDE